MPPKKRKYNYDAKCAITGRPKMRDWITPEEKKDAETCKSCGLHLPWSEAPRLRGYAGVFICDHCDDNYYDEEVRLYNV